MVEISLKPHFFKKHDILHKELSMTATLFAEFLRVWKENYV